VLVGGFPCQSFSNAGRLGRFDDDRGQLFHELMRLAHGCRPRAVLLENVRGLLTHAPTLSTVLDALCVAGYPDVRVCELDAASVLPQRRRRAYLVGFRDAGARRCFGWPHLPALRRAADEVLEFARGQLAPPPLALPFDKWRRVRESSYFARFPGSRLLARGALAQTLQTSYKSGYLLYSQFVPQVTPACTAPTSVAARNGGDGDGSGEAGDGGNGGDGDGGDGVGDSDGGDGGGDDGDGGNGGAMPLSAHAATAQPRFFSPREAARLMGFPESFVLPTGDGLAHRQMGNAVCPPIVGAIGVALAAALEKAEWAAGEAASDADAISTAARPDATQATNTADWHVDAIGEAPSEGDGDRFFFSRVQCAVTTVCLELTLRACADHHAPRWCWMHADALAALGPVGHADEWRHGTVSRDVVEEGVADGVEGGVDGGTADSPELAARRRGAPPPSALSKSDVLLSAGADYHEPLSAEWMGPLPLECVLRRARELSTPPHRRPPLPPDRAAPQQTLPLATVAIKAEVAAPCMRRYLMASTLRGVG
jgi:site-specific DNA-cytosine methylase